MRLFRKKLHQPSWRRSLSHHPFSVGLSASPKEDTVEGGHRGTTQWTHLAATTGAGWPRSPSSVVSMLTASTLGVIRWETLCSVVFLWRADKYQSSHEGNTHTCTHTKKPTMQTQTRKQSKKYLASSLQNHQDYPRQRKPEKLSQPRAAWQQNVMWCAGWDLGREKGH